MIKRIRIWVQQLQQFADRWWYFPLVGLLAALDLFILIVPTDALLISSVMLKPRKWISAALCVAIGSSLGAAALAAVIQHDPDFVMERLFPGAFDSQAWLWTDAFFESYGGIALALVAVSPLVQFPAIAIAALAGMPLADIFVVCLAGRLLKAVAYSYGASHAPWLMMKLPFIRRELAIIDPASTRTVIECVSVPGHEAAGLATSLSKRAVR